MLEFRAKTGAGARIWAREIAEKGVGVLLSLVGALGRPLANSSWPPRKRFWQKL